MNYVSDVVYNIIDNYKNNEREIADGLKWSQYQTIKRINYYKNNKYLKRKDNAIFWNLVMPRINHFVKNIDLDTKDLYPYGEGSTNFYQTYILKARIKKWFKDNKFSVILNDLAEDLAIYGSSVWKKNSDKGEVGMEQVNLNRIYFDPTAETIRDANIVEIHSLTETELRKKKDVWDNVEEVIDREEKDKDKEFPEFEIWEYWGEYEDEDDDKIKYGHFIGFDMGQREIILFSEEDIKSKKCPYYDFHLSKYNGRWLRVGCYERCFDLQVRANKLVYQNEKTQDIASLLLLKYPNAENMGNVINDLETGDIVPDGLEPLPLDNRALSGFIQEMQMIEYQADKLCMTPEVVTGESMPSGTTFRGQAVSYNAAKSGFHQLKERIGEKIGLLLIEEIFPAIVKKWNRGEVFEMTSDNEDLKIYTEALINKTKKNILKEFADKNQKIGASELKQLEEEIAEQVDLIDKKIKTPKGFYDFDYGISVNVTGESQNKEQKNDAYFNALQMVQANPAIVNIPLFKQYCEDNNIKWWKLSQSQIKEMIDTSNQMGGGQAPAGQGIGQKEDKLMSKVDTQE